MLLADPNWPSLPSWLWMPVAVAALIIISLVLTERPNGHMRSCNQNADRKWMAFWLPIGTGIGAAMGSATHNMGVWVGIGVAFGSVIGAISQIAGRKPRR